MSENLEEKFRLNIEALFENNKIDVGWASFQKKWKNSPVYEMQYFIYEEYRGFKILKNALPKSVFPELINRGIYFIVCEVKNNIKSSKILTSLNFNLIHTFVREEPQDNIEIYMKDIRNEEGLSNQLLTQLKMKGENILEVEKERIKLMLKK